MIVVRIADVQAEESFGIGVSMLTPCGASLAPPRGDSFDITVTAEYIFITLRDIPLAEEGLHRFTIAVGKSDSVSIDVPVRLVVNRALADRTGHNAAPTFVQPSSVPGRQVN